MPICQANNSRLINIYMKYKYAVTNNINNPLGSPGKGRKVDPDCWVTGPCPDRREKYYAYLKHKSQAEFRGELYLLTWEDWEAMWSDDLWSRRGRRITDLCLTRLDFEGAWSTDNLIICPRSQHFKIKREQNAARRHV